MACLGATSSTQRQDARLFFVSGPKAVHPTPGPRRAARVATDLGSRTGRVVCGTASKKSWEDDSLHMTILAGVPPCSNGSPGVRQEKAVPRGAGERKDAFRVA